MSAETIENKSQGKRRKNPLVTPLSLLLEIENVMFTFVVDSKGEIIGSKGNIGKNKLRNYGSMCATMFTSAKEANERSDGEGMEITISDNDPVGEIYIRGLERDYILVVRTRKGKNYDEIQREIQKVAKFLTDNKGWMRNQLISTLKQKYK